MLALRKKSRNKTPPGDRIYHIHAQKPRSADVERETTRDISTARAKRLPSGHGMPCRAASYRSWGARRQGLPATCGAGFEGQNLVAGSIVRRKRSLQRIRVRKRLLLSPENPGCGEGDMLVPLWFSGWCYTCMISRTGNITGGVPLLCGSAERKGACCAYRVSYHRETGAWHVSRLQAMI